MHFVNAIKTFIMKAIKHFMVFCFKLSLKTFNLPLCDQHVRLNLRTLVSKYGIAPDGVSFFSDTIFIHVHRFRRRNGHELLKLRLVVATWRFQHSLSCKRWKLTHFYRFVFTSSVILLSNIGCSEWVSHPLNFRSTTAFYSGLVDPE